MIIVGLVLPDVPNHPYSTKMMAEDVAKLLEALNITKAHILGHSYGGCIAQTFAHNYPNLVKSLIIANSFLKLNMRGQLYVDARLKFIETNAVEDAVIEFIASLCFSNDYLSKPGMVQQMIETKFFPITIEGYKNQASGLLEFNSTNWIHQLKMPSLIISSSEDLIADLQDSEFMVRSMPNAQHFCFHNVGHVPFVEQPEVFNSVILSFLRNN